MADMYEQRLKFLKQKLRDLKLAGLLICNYYNIQYLTGLKGLSSQEREFWVLATDKKIYIFTDARYADEVRERISQDSVTLKLLNDKKRITHHLQEIATKTNLKTFGLESEDITYAEASSLTRNKIKTSPTSKIVLELRARKEPSETALLKKACKLTDQCFDSVVKTIRPGSTEADIAWSIEKWIKYRGEDISFYPIVAIDKHSALPHYNTQDNGTGKVSRSSIILIDFGVKHKSYHADMTRMVFMGKPKDRVARVYNSFLKAQVATVKSISRTRDFSHVDRAARENMKREGLPTHPHSTGHGVGLAIHELPKVAQHSTHVSQPGNIFTIEPAVYYRGEFGIRIEDTVSVRQDGRVEVLTTTDKKLRVI